MSKYTKSELTAILEKELRQSLGAPGTEISQIRLRNLQYYKAEAVGELAAPDIPDRSSIVASDVADTVNWMIPSLLRPFATSQESVECEASTPQYAAQAKLASEYLRHLFWKRNRGFNVLHQWFKDAMIQKVGFVKVFWEDTEEDVEENYKGLLPEQVQELLSDEDVEPIEQESETCEIEGQVVELWNVKIKRTRSKGRCRVLGCPPEEMRIHPRARYGEPLQFIAQQFYRTKADLEADGYDLTNVGAEDGWHMEQIERASTQTPWFFDQSDGELARYLCSECYIKLDQDNDGIPEWRKVFMIGQTVMDDEKVDDHPFVYFCPSPMPHVFFGECPADHALMPQRLRTSLLRASLDNVYLSVNKRMGVVEGQVNLDDLVNNRPGGVVRMKNKDALLPIEQGGLDQSAWNLVEWAEQWRESRTGFTRQSNGLNPDALAHSEVGSEGIQVMAERADQRMELIARVAAETAVRVLFEKILKCVCMYQQKADQVELMGQWINIDPREWADAFHIHVNVGLGTGSKDRQAGVFNKIYQMQGPLVQGGAIPPQAAIMAARKFAESAGVNSPEVYFPDQIQHPPQPNPELVKLQAQGQMKQMELQAGVQADQAKREHELALAREQMQMQAQVDTHRQTVEAQQKALEAQNQLQIERERMDREDARHMAELQSRERIAALQAETTVLTAKSSAGPQEGEQAAPEGPNTNELLVQAMQGFQAALERMNQPKTIIRGPDGRVQGVV